MQSYVVPRTQVARSRNVERTRADILRAAREAFAARGYERSGLREIAATAGIDAALIVRYFGSKRKLFIEAVEPGVTIEPLLQLTRKNFGREIVRWMLGLQSHTADPFVTLLRSAGSDDVDTLVTTMLQKRVIEPLAKSLGPPNAEARAALIITLLSGVCTYRNVLPLHALREFSPATANWLRTMFQQLADAEIAPK